MKPLPFYLQNSKKREAFFQGQKGFSLVEIIAALVIIGVLSVFITTGTVRIIEGYLFTRDNTDTAMKGQAALIRIIKEIRSIDKKGIGKKRAMKYSCKVERNGMTISREHTISWEDSASSPLLLNGHILADSVSDFEITYHKNLEDSGDNTWKNKHTMIGITLKLKGASGHISEFSTRITPGYKRFED